MPPMLDRGHHLTFRGAVARQLVGDHHTRHAGLALQQLPQQAFGGPLVPPLLDKNVEHRPILVNSPPEPVLLAADHQAHFVQMPLVSRTGGSRRRIWLANAWPNLRAHCRTVSWLTTIPRAASISSTMRRLSGNRR